MKYSALILLLMGVSLYADVNVTQNSAKVEVLIDNANEHLKNNRVTQGLEAISQAYALDPKSVKESKVSKLIPISIKLSQLKEEAQNNSDPTAWSAAGDIYFDLGLYREAEKFYKKSLALDKTLLHPRIFCALTYAAHNESYRAVEELKIALSYEPENFYANYYMAKILKFQIGDSVRSKKYFAISKQIQKSSGQYQDITLLHE
jgi:tetratricopeptide (TPR) repeat protein